MQDALARRRAVMSFLLALLGTLLFLLPLTACGKKGDPTLRTFEKPAPVREVSAVHRENELILSWSYPADARNAVKGFYVEKAEEGAAGGAGEFRNVIFLKSDVSRYVDRDFVPGRRYWYRVRVYSLRNVLSDDSPVLEARPEPLPPPPSKLSIRVLNDSLEIRWAEVFPGARYNVYRRYAGGNYAPAPVNAAPLETPLFIDGIDKERSVFYTVRTLRATALRDEGFPSEEREVSPASFVPTPPSGLKYVPTPQRVFLLWNGNPETWIYGYRIYRKRGQEKDFSAFGDSLAPAFTDDDPLTEKTLYYVTARGPVRESAPSEVVEVPPLKDDE
ncbi:MAG: hypothetical protein K8I29_13640 [Alphaproteobacteria bacterium]|uniref:Fibronectin type-III domain-containing protein n=1 Tax=Candidatus Nitrobium versatile TaxID=2884831 RepID=A0A953JEJ9_9BACT|nr:hypothetical protein [Candidatus Nitrobium versatile]